MHDLRRPARGSLLLGALSLVVVAVRAGNATAWHDRPFALYAWAVC